MPFWSTLAAAAGASDRLRGCTVARKIALPALSGTHTPLFPAALCTNCVATEALGFDSYLHHRPRGFICGQHCSSVDALCAVHRATLQHQRCGRLGAAVAVGMGNTLGPGETCRRCMLISRGGATRGLTGVQRGKRRGPRCGVRAPAMQRHSISRGRSRLWPSGLQYNA